MKISLVLYNMAEKINNYFNTFNEDILKGSTGVEKEKKVIKKHYWIDILEGIYGISDDYVDVEWKIQMVEDDLNT